MAFVVSIVLLVIISIALQLFTPWWLQPIASNWSGIDATIDITMWVTGFVFVAVNLFLAYCVYRYRYDKNRRANYEPENKKLEVWLTGFTAIGVAALLTPGLFVWASFVNVPEDAVKVEVVGQQGHFAILVLTAFWVLLILLMYLPAILWVLTLTILLAKMIWWSKTRKCIC
jgi:cytochrome c oxidase subunit 2